MFFLGNGAEAIATGVIVQAERAGVVGNGIPVWRGWRVRGEAVG